MGWWALWWACAEPPPREEVPIDRPISVAPAVVVTDGLTPAPPSPPSEEPEPPPPELEVVTATMSGPTGPDRLLDQGQGIADPELLLVDGRLLMAYARDGAAWVSAMNPRTGQFERAGDPRFDLVVVPDILLQVPFFNGPEFSRTRDRLLVETMGGTVADPEIWISEVGFGGEGLAVLEGGLAADDGPVVPIGTISPTDDLPLALYAREDADGHDLFIADVVDRQLSPGFRFANERMIAESFAPDEGTARWAVGLGDVRASRDFASFAVRDDRGQPQVAVWDGATGAVTVISDYGGERVDEAWLLVGEDGDLTAWCTVDQRRFDVYERTAGVWSRVRSVEMPIVADALFTYQYILSPEPVRTASGDYVLMQYNSEPATSDDGVGWIVLLRLDTAEAVIVSDEIWLARRDPEGVVAADGELLVYYTGNGERVEDTATFLTRVDPAALLPDP